MKKLPFVALFSIALAAPAAQALDDFTPVDVSSMTNDSVAALIKTGAIGGDHRAYMPASSLGVAIGLDFGIDVTAIKTPTEFISAMNQISGQPTTSIPELIPLPRFNIHKGLPFGIDLGFSYLSYQSLAKMIGGEVKWNFINGGLVKPNVAVRATGNYLNLWFLQTHTYKVDVTASKSFAIFEPYVGTGLQFWSGDLNVPVTVAQQFPVNVTGHQSGTNPHFYGGMAMKLVFLKLDAEIDYSTAKILTYGGKLSIGF